MSLKQLKTQCAPVICSRQFYRTVRAIIQNEVGVTSIEYALLAGLIAITAMIGISTFGTGLNDLWTMISDKVNSVI